MTTTYINLVNHKIFWFKIQNVSGYSRTRLVLHVYTTELDHGKGNMNYHYMYGSTYSRNGPNVPNIQYKTFMLIKLQ